MTDYQKAKRIAINRRLALLQDAYARGIHSWWEYVRIRASIIAEEESVWSISEQWEEHLADVAEGKTTL